MSDRDPRVDPEPGDVLLMGPQWQIERYEVLGCTAVRVGHNRFVDNVVYRYGPDKPELRVCIADWRKWAATAEVLRRADGTGKRGGE